MYGFGDIGDGGGGRPEVPVVSLDMFPVFEILEALGPIPRYAGLVVAVAFAVVFAHSLGFLLLRAVGYYGAEVPETGVDRRKRERSEYRSGRAYHRRRIGRNVRPAIESSEDYEAIHRASRRRRYRRYRAA